MPDTLPNPVIPPSTVIAPPAAAEPAKPVESAPSAATPEKPVEAETPAKPAAKGKADAVRSIGERIDEVIKNSEKPDKPAETEKPAVEAGQDSAQDSLTKELEAETRHMSAKEKAAWTKLRYENRDFARKLKEQESNTAKIVDLEAKLAAAAESAKPAPDVNNPELEALRTRLSEAEKVLAIKDVEATAEFQNAVTKPKAAIEDMARALASKYSVNEADVFKALNDTSEKRSDLLSEVASGMNEVDRYDFYAAARAFRELGAKADAYRANAKEALAQLESQSQSLIAADTQAQAAARQAAHGTGWAEMQKAVPILTPAQGDDDVTQAWNAEITNAEKFASEADYNKYDVGTQVTIMHRAAVYPLLVGAVSSLQSELANAHAELQKLRGSRPGAGPGVSAERSARDVSKSTDFLERVNERLAAAGV